MAIGTPVSIGTNTLTGSTSPVSITVGASGVAANLTLVSFTGWRTDDAENGAISVSDTDNGAWSEVREQVNSTGGTSDRVRGSIDRISDNLALEQNDTIDAAESGGGTRRSAGIIAVEISGIDLTPSILSNSGGGTTDTPDSGTITPSAGDWILLAMSAFRSNTSTVTVEEAGFTAIATVTADTGVSGSSIVTHAAYNLVTADGLTSYNYQPDWSGSDQNTVSIISAFPAAVAAGVGVRNLIGDTQNAVGGVSLVITT